MRNREVQDFFVRGPLSPVTWWHTRLRGYSLPRGTSGDKPKEIGGNSRPVVPLDALGRTRATLMSARSFIDVQEVLMCKLDDPGLRVRSPRVVHVEHEFRA